MRGRARRGMWGVEVALLCGLLGGCTDPGAATTSSPTPVVDPATGVALLAVVEGQVRVRSAAGVEVAAAAEMPLARTDTVITSPGALVVVVLANGDVLKLEEDQTTPVRALAHLDDPPPRESLAELFEQALGAEAFARVGGAGRLERIAGWTARRASGETPAPVTRPAKAAPRPALKDEAPALPSAPAGRAEPPAEEDQPPEAKPVLDAPQRGGGGPKKEKSGGPTAPPPPKPSRVPQPEVDAEEAKRGDASPDGAPQTGTPLPAADLVDSWTFEAGVSGKVSKDSLPAALAARRAQVARCVADAQPAVTAPKLRLKVVAGAIQALALGGGEAAPACVSGLVGLSLPEAGGDGWAVVRVRR